MVAQKSVDSGFELKGSRVLVTGGSGLIGSNTVEALLKEKAAEIIVLDKFINEGNLAAALSSGKVHPVQGEIMDSKVLHGVLKGVDYVFHLAATTMAAGGQQNPRLILDDTNSYLELLATLGEFKIKKLLFASSVAVYGVVPNPEVPMTEETPLNTRTVYGAGKIACEYFTRVFSDLYGFKYVVLRYGGAYGPRMHTKGYSSQIILRTLDALKSKQPLESEEGEDKEISDYIYVGDIARGNVLGMKSPANDTAFNIVGGESVRVLDVAKNIMKIVGTEIPVKVVPRQRVVHTYVRRFSGEKAARLLNFRPATPMVEGLKRVVEWYKTPG